MPDDTKRTDEIPAPTAALFGILADAFDLLEAGSDEEIALDMFFEEVEFEGEQPRICVTVNDLVSTYHEKDGYVIVATFADDEEGEGGPCPWFRRDTPEAAAAQTAQVLVDAGFLDDGDAALMAPAFRPAGDPG
jgi:hypothetical protein